jgi:2-dehydro-3-deoxy-D-arabinonate dehydratase
MPAIKIYKTIRGIVINHGDDFFLSKESDWDTFVNRNDLFKKVSDDIKGLKARGDLSEVTVSNLSWCRAALTHPQAVQRA